MCLAMPMKVLSIDGDTAVVSASAVEMTISTALVESVKPGDFVIVHAGFAIETLGASEAEETLAIFKRLGQS